MDNSIQQWEYCQLTLSGWEEHKGKWYYKLSVRYFDKNKDHNYFDLGKYDDKKTWQHNPWERAMSLLGVAGWELVSIQHPTQSDPGLFGPWFIYNHSIAYFKRPICVGRNIDEPKLIL